MKNISAIEKYILSDIGFFNSDGYRFSNAEMARKFGVSRRTIINAINRLKSPKFKMLIDEGRDDWHRCLKVNGEIFALFDRPKGERIAPPSSENLAPSSENLAPLKGENPAPIDNNIREPLDNNKNKYLKIFDEARKLFRGTKRGLQTEFANFRKKNKDWKVVLPLLKPAIENQIKWRKRDGIFWKHFKTWINNRCWEEEEPQFYAQCEQIQNTINEQYQRLEKEGRI